MTEHDEESTIAGVMAELLMESNEMTAVVVAYQKGEDVICQWAGEGALPLGLAQHLLGVIMREELKE